MGTYVAFEYLKSRLGKFSYRLMLQVGAGDPMARSWRLHRTPSSRCNSISLPIGLASHFLKISKCRGKAPVIQDVTLNSDGHVSEIVMPDNRHYTYTETGTERHDVRCLLSNPELT